MWTSAISFVASANAAVYCGARVEFIDISLDDYNLDVSSLKKKLSEAKKNNKIPKAIIVVHFAGNPCKMDQIYLLKKNINLKLLRMLHTL